MKEERDDSYGHVLKYTGVFGGVQGLNILMNSFRPQSILFRNPLIWAFRLVLYVMYLNSLMQAMRLASHTSLRWFVRGRC